MIKQATLMTLAALAFAGAARAQEAQPTPARQTETDRYPKRRADQGGGSAVSATFTVRPGQSIQAAADRASPGDRIEVWPGVYHESFTIDRDNIQLLGVTVNGERPVLDGKGTMNDAVLAAGNDFLIQGLTIRNYQGNGVVVNQSKNVRFIDLVIENTGKYGIYPLTCEGVLVDRVVCSGVWDAAIYVGQCKDAVIQNCEAYHNTVGIEAENSTNVLISNNTAHDNSLGILLVLLPNLPVKQASDARIVGNRVFNNNHKNTAPGEGTIVHLIEPGMGIMVNGFDNVEVTDNDIHGHNSYGVLYYSLSDAMPGRQLDIDPNPDGGRVHGNRYARNGEDPAKVTKSFTEIGATGGDLFWSGKGIGNGWKETTTRSFPPNLPGIAGGN